MAEPFFQDHIRGDLVQGHVPGAFDHHLDIALPGPLGQLAQYDHFLNLDLVRGVVQGARTAAVAQAQGHVLMQLVPKPVLQVLQVVSKSRRNMTR